MRTKQQLGHEVAVGHRVERVVEAAREAEVGGGAVGIERQARARERAGAERRHVGAARARRAAARRRARAPRSARGGGARAAPAARAAGACSRAGRRRCRPASAALEQHAPGARAIASPSAAPSRRTKSRSAVATWSLRLRPVWSLAPASPASSVTRRSIAVWMSSSVGANTNVPSASSTPTVSSAARIACVSSSVISLTRPSMRTCAREPVEVVGREAPVERQAGGEREQLVGRPGAEPAVPERLRFGRGSDDASSSGSLIPGRPGGGPPSPPTGPTGARSPAASSWRNASAAS